MRLLFQSLLRLYPPRYRREFSEEMLDVLSDVRADLRKQRFSTRILRGAREVEGLLLGAVQEHFRPSTGLCVSMFAVRRFSMRSEFRFPKTMTTLMTVILAGVLMAIAKARAISVSVPQTSSPVGPIRPVQVSSMFTLPVALFLSAFAVAAIGWGILYMTHRSGMHRLSEFDPADRRS
ncbi:MAG TPA: hypothetical protein VLL05_13690 [Terriglobales bacterium]|nr:hypothetical protein [Terriglobales bacterium]